MLNTVEKTSILLINVVYILTFISWINTTANTYITKLDIQQNSETQYEQQETMNHTLQIIVNSLYFGKTSLLKNKTEQDFFDLQWAIQSTRIQSAYNAW